VQVQAHVEGKLRAMGLSLLEMRMMDRPADLAVAGRR
jgi:hypothetical protein